MNNNPNLNKLPLCDNLSVSENGELYFAEQSSLELVQRYGTPLYLIDENKMRSNIRAYKTAMQSHYSENSFPLYASKALSFKQAYRIAKEENIGVDVVSSGELFTAISAGFPTEKVFFHGNNKTIDDITYAIENKIGYFVADNFDELDSIDTVAKKFGIKQKILLRITPGIDPHTFEAVNTGKVDSKFGAAIETGQAKEIASYAISKENLLLCGFHCHIGSQIFESQPFIDAVEIMLGFTNEIQKEFGCKLEILNLGGGFGVPYIESEPRLNIDKIIFEISEHAKMVCQSLDMELPAILHEPGRSICADTGLTLYTAGSIKEIPGFKNYVSIDGGMTDNPRFALYSSQYTVYVANRANDERDYKCSIAGRCCESGDMIAEDIQLQRPQKGDIIAVCTTGAYNYSMASNYNRLCRPPIVMLKDSDSYVAVKRETFEDLTKNDI